MREAKLEITMMPVEALVPYENNAKIHTDKQIEHIAASIEKYGFNDPIGIWHNPEGVAEIVTGHGALMAAKQLGLVEVPCTFLDHLSDEERRIYCHVHNQTQLETGFDVDSLITDMDNLNAEWENLGFEAYCYGDIPDEWFERKDREANPFKCPSCGEVVEGTPKFCPGCGYLLEESAEYNEFVDKFKPKKTTDDCYTPDAVYDAVADWVSQEYGVDRSKFVRPFYPGGDYESHDYPPGCVVVDNPPFSLMASIIRFYLGRGIPFFVFAPTLTLFSGRNLDVCYIAADCDITYENGAKVNTSFITNLDGQSTVRTAPSLNAAVMEADKRNREDMAKPVNLKYRYPPYVITAAMVSQWSNYGVDFRLKRGGGCQIGALDAQRELGKAIYGSGFLVSEKAKADVEKAKADVEKAKADVEKAKALEAAKALGDGVEVDGRTGEVVWKLSDRELEMVRAMG